MIPELQIFVGSDFFDPVHFSGSMIAEIRSVGFQGSWRLLPIDCESQTNDRRIGIFL